MRCSKYARFPSYCITLCSKISTQDISYYKFKPKFKENDYPADLVQKSPENTTTEIQTQ